MSRLIRTISLTTVALVFAAVVGSGAISQTIPGSQETVLTFVHDVLQTFYPEEISKGNALVLAVSHPADASWREISGVYFKVTPTSSDSPDPLTSASQTPAILSGSFWLRPQQFGRVQQLVLSLDTVRMKPFKDVRQLVESHPEWHEADAVRELKRAGARYGPAEKEEFVKSLHLQDADKFLGKLRVTSVEFNGLGSTHTGNFAAGSLDWIVRADGTLPDGQTVTYSLTFEPFAGKLILLSRR